MPERPHDVIQVVGVYATKWRYPVDGPALQNATFAGTRLEEFETTFKELLPRLPRPIITDKIPTDAVRFIRDQDLEVTVTAADVFLLVLPSDQVVATFTVDCQTVSVATDAALAVDMLDEFSEDAFTIKDLTLEQYLNGLAPKATRAFAKVGGHRSRLRRMLEFFKRPAPVIPPVELTERHQIVFVSDGSRLGPATVDRLVYRRQPRFWKEFVQRKDPKELNERGHSGVVTTNVSFIQGHHSLLEHSVFLATVQAVGTLSRFRQIWERAYESVRRFRQEQQRNDNGTQAREDLEDLVDLLGNLEFDLTFSVEFPLMRIESYHSALSDVLDLNGQSTRLSNMFDQLGGSVRSEMTAIDIRRSERHDLRSRRNTFAFNVLAIVGVAVSVLLAFFGVSTSDVDKESSLRDWHRYSVEYLVAIILGLLPIVVLLLTHGGAKVLQYTGRKLRRWWKAREDRRLSR